MKVNVFNALSIILAGIFLHSAALTSGEELRPKYVSDKAVRYLPSNNAITEFEIDPFMSTCLEECKRRSQMVAMGIEAIMESCQYQCDIDQAREVIKSGDRSQRLEATRTLCELADRSTVPDLIALLKEDMEKRTGIWAEIIPALGRVRDDRAVPLLKELAVLPDDDWLGREMAVDALGEIGNPSAAGILINVSWRADTRDAAIIALSKLNSPRAASTLVSAIQPEEEPSTREAAIEGLLRLGSDAVPAIYDEYVNYSKENLQSFKRLKLCEILGEINSEQSREILKQSFDDIDPAVSKCARQLF